MNSGKILTTIPNLFEKVNLKQTFTKYKSLKFVSMLNNKISKSFVQSTIFFGKICFDRLDTETKNCFNYSYRF